METPNYVLKTNEAVLIPEQESKGVRFLRIGVIVVLSLLLLGSFLFGDNLFAELSWSARCFLIILIIAVVVKRGKSEYQPSPMELQFYDDYLILYLPKRYYDRRTTRKEINKMKYSEITKCVYKARSQRIHLYGGGTCMWFNYDKNGRVPEVPTKTKVCKDGGLLYFSTRCASEVDFKEVIEEHSPIKVIIEND